MEELVILFWNNTFVFTHSWIFYYNYWNSANVYLRVFILDSHIIEKYGDYSLFMSEFDLDETTEESLYLWLISYELNFALLLS